MHKEQMMKQIKKPKKEKQRKLPLYLKKILVLFFHVMEVPGLTMSPEEIDMALYKIAIKKDVIGQLSRKQKALLTLYLNKHNVEVWYAAGRRKKSA